MLSDKYGYPDDFYTFYLPEHAQAVMDVTFTPWMVEDSYGGYHNVRINKIQPQLTIENTDGRNTS